MKKPLIYEIGEYLHINASGPRPLLQAVDALQQKYGWVIDYEDPHYSVPLESAASTASPPNRRHSMAQQGGENGFSMQFNIGSNSAKAPDETALLQAVIDANNQSSAAGQFKLLKQEGGTFAVVGVSARGADGQVANQQPILDTPITLAKTRRTAASTITLISHHLSEDAKLPVATQLSTGLFQYLAEVGGSATPARTLLVETLAGSKAKTYWQLLYDPQSKSYQLNIKERPAAQ